MQVENSMQHSVSSYSSTAACPASEGAHTYSPHILLSRLSSDPDFQFEQQRASRKAVWAQWTCRVGIASMLLLFHAGVILLCVTNFEQAAIACTLLAVAMLMAGVAGTALHDYYRWVHKACAPLAESGGCVAAAQLMRDFTKAREIRDAALAQHRQLYWADLYAMEDVTWGRYPDYSAEKVREACAEIHGVSPG